LERKTGTEERSGRTVPEHSAVASRKHPLFEDFLSGILNISGGNTDLTLFILKTL
jgi:hypothetical protein